MANRKRKHRSEFWATADIGFTDDDDEHERNSGVSSSYESSFIDDRDRHSSFPEAVLGSLSSASEPERLGPRDARRLFRYHLTKHGVSDIPADHAAFCEVLRPLAKQWCFQLERGSSTGALHYQVRISLKSKTTKSRVIAMFPGCHVSVETNAAADGLGSFYAMKPEGRVAGPWTDKDPLIYRDPMYDIADHLLPWQKMVIERLATQDNRKILIVVDPVGNSGKTVLAHHLVQYHDGKFIPPFCQSGDEILQFTHGLCKSGEMYTIIIDIPRAALHERLAPRLFSAFETIKSGYLYEKRYRAQVKYIKPPKIVCFTNVLPDQALLTGDRWDILTLPIAAAIQPIDPFVEFADEAYESAIAAIEADLAVEPAKIGFFTPVRSKRPVTEPPAPKKARR